MVSLAATRQVLIDDGNSASETPVSSLWLVSSGVASLRHTTGEKRTGTSRAGRARLKKAEGKPVPSNEESQGIIEAKGSLSALASMAYPGGILSGEGANQIHFITDMSEGGVSGS